MIFTWQKQPPKVFIEISQNSQENTCTRVSFLIKLQAWGLAQVFCCEFCEISKNTFFKQLWVTASDLSKKKKLPAVNVWNDVKRFLGKNGNIGQKWVKTEEMSDFLGSSV